MKDDDTNTDLMLQEIVDAGLVNQCDEENGAVEVKMMPWIMA